MVEDDNGSRETRAQLVERLDFLEQALRQNTQRLHHIEQYLSLAAPAPPPRAERQPLPESIAAEREAQPTPHATPHDISAPAAEALDAHTTTAAGTPTGTPPPLATPPGTSTRSPAPRVEPRAKSAGADEATHTPPRAAHKPRRDLETIVGGSWFNWAGIIAVVFAVAFSLKLAFESGWIGPTARVILGGVVGVAFLGFAERLRAKGLRQYAYVLSGGGVLILYLSVYAAYDFYHLINQAPAFLLMALVTMTAVLLSVRFDALPIAVLGLIGGFLTPILLTTGQDNQVGLFTYVALLDAGVLALAYFKGWRSLNYVSFLATLLTFVAWLGVHYAREKLWLTIFFLALFFLIYSTLAVVHNVLKRRPARWFDICLISVNASFFFGLSYGLLNEEGYHYALGSVALLVSAFYTGLFYVAWRGHRADRLLTYAYVGAAATFFTMAIAIQLDQHWITVGWAIEGLMLTWVGLRSETRAPRHAALVVFACAVAHWFGNDVGDFIHGPNAAFVPLLNRRAFSCVALIASLAAGAWLYRREDAAEAKDDGHTLGALYTLAANALLLTLLTLDTSDYFETRKLAAGARNEAGDVVARLENARQLSISALWTFYAAGALALGFRRHLKAVRYGAVALLALATIKVLASDLAFYAAPWHAPLFNGTFAAFALLVLAYASAARLYGRDEQIGADERAVVPVLVIVANALALVALSAEALGHFQSRISAGLVEAAGLRDLELAKQLSLSIIWAAYGGALLVFGRLRRNRLLRLMALLLLALTTLKVFFLDLSSLDRVYRIISFIVLGAILLAVSYLYQRSQQQQSARDNKEDGREEDNTIFGA